MGRNRWERKKGYQRRGAGPDSSNSLAARIVFIPVHAVVLSDRNRAALARDWAQVEDHRRELESGKELLPVKVRQRDDGRFDIEDGRHRFLACELSGQGYVSCIVL